VGLGSFNSAVFANSERRNDYGNRASDKTSRIYKFGNGYCQRKLGCFIGFSQVVVL
jgi:hypothetical protein